jgi:hypothetical protein
MTPFSSSTCRYSFTDRKTQHQENLRDTNRTLGRWANRGCNKQPVDKRPMYAACTQKCVSSAFGTFGSAEIKDLACYQYVGKFNSVPGHHVFKDLQDFQNALSFQFIPKLWRGEIRLGRKCALCFGLGEPGSC